MDTIAAIATSPGQAAVALIRISGPAALEIAGAVFRGAQPLGEIAPRRQSLGAIVDARGERIDQVLACVFRAPASYTGEDVVEFSGHGGALVAGRVLSAVLSAGARAAEPGEFSRRAFLNGKMDLTQAEAVMDLIEARSSLALKAANRQLEGALGARAGEIRSALLEILAHVEAHIDFPDEDIDPETASGISGRLAAARDAATALMRTSEQGRILRDGLAVAICGPPNAGKSSLLNRLLGMERAIVSETAGTTRDTIEELVTMKGIPVRLIDTAGLREVDDGVEQEGIRRATREAQRADVVLEIFDASCARPESGAGIAAGGEARRLRVLNKADLDRHESWDDTDGVLVSCLEGSGLEALVDAIVDPLLGGEADWASDLVSVNARHRRCLERVCAHAQSAIDGLDAGRSPEFVAIDARAALEAIGEVVGEADIEELLGAIFSRFCIGK